MASLNKVMLIGRLTKNPDDPRVLPNSGSTVVKFRLAVGRRETQQVHARQGPGERIKVLEQPWQQIVARVRGLVT